MHVFTNDSLVEVENPGSAPTVGIWEKLWNPGGNRTSESSSLFCCSIFSPKACRRKFKILLLNPKLSLPIGMDVACVMPDIGCLILKLSDWLSNVLLNLKKLSLYLPRCWLGVWKPKQRDFDWAPTLMVYFQNWLIRFAPLEIKYLPMKQRTGMSFPEKSTWKRSNIW